MMTLHSPQSPQRESKAKQAYDWIRERIRTREYEPGYRLVLSTIAEELDVSVVPVREAIRTLTAEGLVTYEHNVGARVSELNRKEYYNIMGTLAVLEAAALSLSAPLLEEVDLAAAEDANRKMGQMLDQFDPVEFTELNMEFHRILFSKCTNSRLLDLVYHEWEELGRYRVSSFRYIPERAQESVAEHAQLLALIRAGVPAHHIEEAAKQHRLATRRRYKKRIEDSSSPRAAPAVGT